MEVVDELKVLGNVDDFLSVYSPEADMKLKLAEAREYGETSGEAKGVEKTARNMLEKDFEPEVISEVTGLSTSKIKSFMI